MPNLTLRFAVWALLRLTSSIVVIRFDARPCKLSQCIKPMTVLVKAQMYYPSGGQNCQQFSRPGPACFKMKRRRVGFCPGMKIKA